MSLYLAILSVLVIAAQVSCEGWDYSSLSELQSEHLKLGEELKSFVTSVAESARDQVENHVKYAQETLENSQEKGLRKINDQYDSLRRNIRSINAPQVCLDEAETMLEVSQKSTGSSFFRCNNLTTAALDIVDIGMDSLELVTNVLFSLDDILNGFSDCWSWNPITFTVCTFKYIKTAFGDVFNTFSQLKEYTDNITSLVKDIKDQIDFCSNAGVNQAQQDTVRSLQHIHQCSQNLKNQNH